MPLYIILSFQTQKWKWIKGKNPCWILMMTVCNLRTRCIQCTKFIYSCPGGILSYLYNMHAVHMIFCVSSLILCNKIFIKWAHWGCFLTGKLVEIYCGKKDPPSLLILEIHICPSSLQSMMTSVNSFIRSNQWWYIHQCTGWHKTDLDRLYHFIHLSIYIYIYI